MQQPNTPSMTPTPLRNLAMTTSYTTVESHQNKREMKRQIPSYVACCGFCCILLIPYLVSGSGGNTLAPSAKSYTVHASIAFRLLMLGPAATKTHIDSHMAIQAATDDCTTHVQVFLFFFFFLHNLGLVSVHPSIHPSIHSYTTTAGLVELHQSPLQTVPLVYIGCALIFYAFIVVHLVVIIHRRSAVVVVGFWFREVFWIESSRIWTRVWGVRFSCLLRVCALELSPLPIRFN